MYESLPTPQKKYHKIQTQKIIQLRFLSHQISALPSRAFFAPLALSHSPGPPRSSQTSFSPFLPRGCMPMRCAGMQSRKTVGIVFQVEPISPPPSEGGSPTLSTRIPPKHFFRSRKRVTFGGGGGGDSSVSNPAGRYPPPFFQHYGSIFLSVSMNVGHVCPPATMFAAGGRTPLPGVGLLFTVGELPLVRPKYETILEYWNK